MLSRVKFVTVAALVLALILGFASFAQAAPVGNFAKDELLVKFKPWVKNEELVHAKNNAKAVDKNMALGITKVKVNPGRSLEQVMENYKKNPDVEFVQPNYLYKVNFTPNDPYYSYQWGPPKIQADLAWDVFQGDSGVVIAIVDTGIDTNHPDLIANLTNGYNAINNTTNAKDDYGHGTHVAGIAAAVINNSTGVAGLAGKSRLMPVKVLDNTGSGWDYDIAEGIQWAADNGAKVINLSLGSAYYSSTMASAINYAYSKGVLVVASAGNSGTEQVNYPAGYDHVIGVAATDSSDLLAAFSSYGSHVDVSAPGVDILSTYWSSTYGSTYAYADGTSMAAPFVSGLGALLFSQNPLYTPDQVEQLIESQAVDLGTAGWDKYYGYGRINAYRSLLVNYSDTTPPVISNVTDSPDPFTTGRNKTCTISYTLSENALVTIKILDAAGNVIRVLENGANKLAGTNSVKWDGKNSSGSYVASGTYTYTIYAVDGNGNGALPVSGTITVTSKTAKGVSAK